MNPLLIQQGLTVANQLRALFLNNSSRKVPRTVYDELRDSSANISDLREYLEALDRSENATLPESEARHRQHIRAQSSPVKQAAHVRLANRRARLERDIAADDALDFTKAKERLSTAADDATKNLRSSLKPWRKKVKKQSAKVQKAANKARSRAERKVRKRQRANTAARVGKGLGVTAGVLTLLAALGAAILYVIGRKKDEPATRPPRVEEHSGERESKLVYQSTTEKPAGDLAEDPAVRDEELLGSIDDQLAAHRRDSDAVAEASESADEAADRLRRETEQAEAEFTKTYSNDSTSGPSDDEEAEIEAEEKGASDDTEGGAPMER